MRTTGRPFLSELLSVKIVFGFMRKRFCFVFFPEDTMKVFGFKCNNGHDSPTQNIPTFSNIVFWKNAFCTLCENIIRQKFTWEKF
jgi:hypothetical protein